ncbi:MAG: hypothetical protein KDC49_20955 [Saprospiraceae bacterium]|nr:hypothetical protein [Saprospiraceae bacterium]
MDQNEIEKINSNLGHTSAVLKVVNTYDSIPEDPYLNKLADVYDTSGEDKRHDKCKANKDCLLWNLDQNRQINEQYKINARTTEKGFTENSIGPVCSITSIIPKYYSENYLQEYDSSYINTGISDGKLFCINSEIIENSAHVRVLYHRNEGGHTSDEVILSTMAKDSAEYFMLVIMSHFGKDGYQRKIEGQIVNKKLYKRTIIEEFGWTTYGDLCPQPKRKTTQMFTINDDGSFQLLEEKTVTENFEFYITSD